MTDWRCLDCGIDTDDVDGLGHDEYFMIRDELWRAIHPEVDGQLCIGCTENRLGRRLVRADFTDVVVNTDPARPTAKFRSRLDD